MKTNILNTIAAAAVFSFTLFGCTTASESTLDESVTAVTPVSEGEMIDEQAEFMTRFEAETRSAGLAPAEAGTYENMFSDVANTADYTFLELAKKSSELSTFVELLDEADMITALEEYTGRSFTIFAPTNAAFDAMPAGMLEELRKPEHRNQLIRLLQAHMLVEPVAAAQFTDNQQIQFGHTLYIPVKVSDDGSRQVNVGGATIVKPDVNASNGVIHVVDAVVQPVNPYKEAK
ncbi:fasciclin domain-containing protein [Botryobacter ruber]|uniref:fasciclin domain-containing protein n=1 Tax=Botryobacter ruber TaxID=2171629 RepID=UPI000E09FFCA|nr:fasciclin domain-containing protein [Botryobacter ruber]